MSGKTTSRYQRSYLLNLPQPGPWNIRVSRTSPKIDKVNVQHDLFLDSIPRSSTTASTTTAPPASACSSIPSSSRRSPSAPIWSTGILCNVPINYNPLMAPIPAYGTAHSVRAWSNNPAWVFYDILINNRHGIGGFLVAGPGRQMGALPDRAMVRSRVPATARAASSGALPATSRSPRGRKPST